MRWFNGSANCEKKLCRFSVTRLPQQHWMLQLQSPFQKLRQQPLQLLLSHLQTLQRRLLRRQLSPHWKQLQHSRRQPQSPCQKLLLRSTQRLLSHRRGHCARKL